MVDVLVQFVDSVPQPLTGALVDLAPFLNVAARSARLVEWSDEWYSSWLVLVGWWIVCLAAPILFRYALPLVTAVLLTWITRHRQSPALVTESVLQNALADLSTLRGALPEQKSIPTPRPPIVILRAAAILTVPWLVFTYFVSARIILAVMGTVILIRRAPWARVLCSVVWRSAFVRTCVYRIQAFLTGEALPKYVVSNQPTTTTPSPVPSLRFLFTVYENQRWWMGLDWTAALLPSERPSWSSPSLHPVSPPTGFTLPDPTTIYLPSADGKSRVKRTAVWRWEEPEWRLVVRKEGSSLSRIERVPPPIDDTNPSAQASSSSTASSNRLLKAAASKFKESASGASPTSSSISGSPSTDIDAAPSDHTDQNHSEEPSTDPDGWIYGDNKWENQSYRGGLGKYTRYRRWSRVAVVTESVQVVAQGELGMQSPQPISTSTQHKSSPPSSPTTSTLPFSEPKTQSPEALALTPSPPSPVIVTPDPESPLRQRLRAALSKSSIPPPSS